MHSHQNFLKFSRVENIILKYLNKQFSPDAVICYANYNFYSDSPELNLILILLPLRREYINILRLAFKTTIFILLKRAVKIT